MKKIVGKICVSKIQRNAKNKCWEQKNPCMTALINWKKNIMTYKHIFEMRKIFLQIKKNISQD